MNHDRIHLRQLQVGTRLGVPEVERARPQTVAIDLEMTPRRPFGQLDDQLERTVDYHAVAGRVAEVAAARERLLAETLAVEIAEVLMAEFPLQAVEVRIDKAALPQAAAVGVSVRRER